MTAKRFLFIAIASYYAGISCSGPSRNDFQEVAVQIKNNMPRDTVIDVNGRAVNIQYPHDAAATILCLPGWNFGRNDMCEKSTFCTAATNKTFILVRPEMGKSIYASSIYPETRKDWSSYPQLKFITDTLIPELQAKFSLLKPGQNNFLYGISTGARGVAMIALHTGKLFKAGAALSGDYEQTRMPKDNLKKGYYGELDKFKERWQKDDPYLHAAEIKIPLYLAHGGSDKVVPTEQTKIFFKKLKEVSPALKHELHIADSAGHNYDFWGKETDEVLKFFFAHDK